MRGFIGALRPRLGRLAGIVVSLLIIAGFAFVLLQIASGGSPAHATVGDDPTSTPPPTALATATSAATNTATAAPHATSTPTGSGPGAPSAPGFSVQTVTTESVDMQSDDGYPSMVEQPGAPIPTVIGGCGPHVIFWVSFALTLSNNPTPPNQKAGPTALIYYYLRMSDGSSQGSASHPLSEWIPSGGTSMSIENTTWQMSYTLANGASQWTELHIVQPNHITYRVNYKALCEFSLTTPKVSVSPKSYNCATGGDQTFTVTGTLEASFTPDTSSHTVTYYWENEFSTHGTTTPTQTVTFPPGVTSMPVQPDIVIGNATNQTAAFEADLYPTDGSSGSVTVTSAC